MNKDIWPDPAVRAAGVSPGDQAGLCPWWSLLCSLRAQGQDRVWTRRPLCDGAWGAAREGGGAGGGEVRPPGGGGGALAATGGPQSQPLCCRAGVTQSPGWLDLPTAAGPQLPFEFLGGGPRATPKRTGFTSLLPERQMDPQAWRVGEGSRSLIPVPGCFFDQSGIDQSGISPKRCGALGKSHPIPHFTSLREKILIHGRAFMVYKMTSWSSLVALRVKDLA